MLLGEQISEASDFISSTLKNFISDNKIITTNDIVKIFKPQMQVDNERTKYFIHSASEEGKYKFSVCLDRVTFKYNNDAKTDYQIEVELESDYIHRVSMKFFTDNLEKLLGDPIEHEKYSKYEKGLAYCQVFLAFRSLKQCLYLGHIVM